MTLLFTFMSLSPKQKHKKNTGIVIKNLFTGDLRPAFFAHKMYFLLYKFLIYENIITAFNNKEGE